ncbi:hypothetical protein [Acrocarpospora sp. B8E8]|uniref:hypothetical protein n=1 Tax=Acrocarpospora sp. B8E8 TaxID=3153572 RepID=UPI00325F16F9
MLRRLAIVFALLTGVLVVAPGTAFACSCAAPPPTELMNSADSVFRGVVSTRTSTGDPFDNQPVTFTFSVGAVYKGEATERLQVRSHPQSATCGADFEVGKQYLVFAISGSTDWVPPIENVPLYTHLCAGNRPILGAPDATLVPANIGPGMDTRPASELISALGTPSTPPKTTTISPSPAAAPTRETTGPSPWWLLALLPLGAATWLLLRRRPQS